MNIKTKFLSLIILFITASHSSATELKSGEYFITQSWSQESNYKHSYYLEVPTKKSDKPYPVLIILHGMGGKAKGRMFEWFNRPGGLIKEKYIIVSPQGYRSSWNIVSEPSKANDLGYIEAIINELSKFSNVEKENFSIMGISNGAALVNQIAIETKLTSIKNYISAVSPLNGFQHDGKNFKIKGDDNNYTKIATPLKGVRLMNISGTNDGLIPYDGGTSKFIPAKDGKLSFVPAEESIYLWAKHMGYVGKKLTKPTSVNGKIEEFSYLDGDIIHYKVVDGRHGAWSAIKEDVLLKFLVGSKGIDINAK